MAEIEITLPTVTYGNVKVRATPEELGLQSIADGYDLGVAAAVYLNVFAQGFKKGASLDVADRQEAAPGNPQAATTEPPGGRTVAQVMSDEDVDTEAEARAIIEKELGSTTVVEADAAPWDKKAEASKPKPWETGTKTPDKVIAGLGSDW